MDKAARTGLRMLDLLNAKRLEAKFNEQLLALQKLYPKSEITKLDQEEILAQIMAAGKILKIFIIDTVPFIHDLEKKKKKILFEGAQGTFLDIDFGTYPYVTSSNTTAGGACTGSGFPPHKIDKVIGVIKAYGTRVGEGPFLTEDKKLSDMLHAMGREFGATTGRARRCGWYDAVMARYAQMVNGIDEMAVTNLDGLDSLDEIKVCTAYKTGSKTLDIPPSDCETLSRCKPVYTTLAGWKTDTSEIKSYARLPAKAKAFLKTIGKLTGAPVSIASTGPRRDQTLFA